MMLTPGDLARFSRRASDAEVSIISRILDLEYDGSDRPTCQRSDQVVPEIAKRTVAGNRVHQNRADAHSRIECATRHRPPM